ncbi:hypothetical protein COT44_02260 [Candidatus Shapirobacteria bacterium CG08_land_8_20_14_0_20_39_18]|uniref:Transposase IS200-like domain-containing protein n=1 Tax=Candidatus Shapirobacteria bacterium CG08_land_8_20_14_0_20_39_18 TaxID=1974883 RepID=A0A2M6XD45_9BACT|nr:MAG: hypothetical protein COT44_02260 [Candidatus Shapirobacteria bacterium CG08_land_8_20_14_0_20_39_18]PIY66134.1 MAG: hypothetical protein COY91_01530 [Candidatus Shapirobacteria bacterium CG_4_10_14_0_8_um_filter_39_15]
MTTFRKIVFRNNYYYHIYNRSIEKKPIFNNLREYSRAVLALQFYRFSDLPTKLSKFLVLNQDVQLNYLKKFNTNINKLVDILAYGIMPNHFHFILEQKQEGGIARFISNFENSYTKYYNTKEDRVGPIFQGLFKSVYVESDEQLVHLSRYIHLNPVSSSLIKPEELENYPWSSFPEYLNLSKTNICNTQPVLSLFSSVNKYRNFVYDQIAYAKELEKIKHLIME